MSRISTITNDKKYDFNSSIFEFDAELKFDLLRLASEHFKHMLLS